MPLTGGTSTARGGCTSVIAGSGRQAFAVAEYDADLQPIGRRLITTWPTVVDPHVPQGMIFVVFDPARCEHVAMVHPSYEETKRGIRR